MTTITVLAIRVTSDADVGYERTVAFVRRFAKRYFIVEHETDTDCDKKHIHVLAWLEGPVSRSVAGWRQMFVKTVKPSGNRQYSMKPAPEPDVMERYMCHAEAEGSAVKVIAAQPPVDDPSRYSAQWCQAQNAAFYAAQRDFKQSRKKRDEPLWKRILEAARDEGISARETERVARLAVELIMREERTFNVYQARMQVQTALLHLSGSRGDYVEEMVRLLARPPN